MKKNKSTEPNQAIRVKDPLESLRGAYRLIRPIQSILGLLVIFVVAIVISPRARGDGSIIFLSEGNLTNILRQVSEIGIIALAMTFVILTAGIDLCVGSILALSASITAFLLVKWPDPTASSALSTGVHIAIAVSAALALSTFLGALNGATIAFMRLQPFIVTLAAMIGVRGLARWLTNNRNIDVGFAGATGETATLGADPGVVFANFFTKNMVIALFIGSAILFGFVLRYTVLGRYIRALGDNARASLYAGLPIKRVQIFVYALSGLMAGLAGVIHCAQNHQGSPNDGMAFELDAIAAVVIGGTSLSGGRGTIWGAVVGTLIMGVLRNMFRLKGVDSNVEMMCKAVIIILAVWIQRSRS